LRVLDTLLTDLPSGWTVDHVHIGENWILSVMDSRAGLASTPDTLSTTSRFHVGINVLHQEAAQVAELARSDNPLEAAIGLATLNGLLDPDALSDIDAADWLMTHGKDRRVAVVGRFPFVAEELIAVARQVWVFEREPAQDEYSAADMPTILPQAELVAITSSTLLNHTLDDILIHIPASAWMMLLGPSTPLSPKLFALGFDVLSGVQVIDIQETLNSVQAGVSFRKMQGVRRVTLLSDRVRDWE
jgi:uncharacterized protein